MKILKWCLTVLAASITVMTFSATMLAAEHGVFFLVVMGSLETGFFGVMTKLSFEMAKE
jgi:hypothetical protein